MAGYRSSWLTQPPSEDYFSSFLSSPTSEEFSVDFNQIQDRGTPTIGLYSQDGLWDDDDDTSSDARTVTTARYSSTTGHNTSGGNSKVGSLRGRSRSGTIISTANTSSEEKSGWNWGGTLKKKGGMEGNNMIMTSLHARDIVKENKEKESKEKSLKKKESKSKLKGKGRRGELTVVVDPDESFGTIPPPMPPTPSSYLTSPTTSKRYVSPLQSTHDENLPPTPTSASSGTPGKSKWSRGVSKIFRSKSSAALALREITNDTNSTPPVPAVPSGLPQNKHLQLGKPFTATPSPKLAGLGLGMDDYDNSQRMHIPQQSISSIDPFNSSITKASNGEPLSPPPSASKLPRHSPSLKNLKDFMTPKSKLAKSRSMANIKNDHVIPPSPIRSEWPPMPSSELPLPPPMGGKSLHKRMGSLASLKFKKSSHNLKDQATPLEISSPIPTPDLSSHGRTFMDPVTSPLSTTFGVQNMPSRSQTPIESPPLPHPNPPYFPTSTRMSQNPSSESNLMGSISAPATPAPTAPLPPLPAPTTEPLSSGEKLSNNNTLPRSGSSYKLLPRSRSTSMSLSSPPKSSSFFDLYEQLGIWPTATAEKSKPKTSDATTGSKDKPKDNLSSAEGLTKIDTTSDKDKQQHDISTSTITDEDLSESPAELAAVKGTISHSSSMAMSFASLEAAINAFPIFHDKISPLTSPLYEKEGIEFMGADKVEEINQAVDESFMSNVAVAGVSPSSSVSHTMTAVPSGSECTAGPNHYSSQQQASGSRPTNPNAGRGRQDSRNVNGGRNGYQGRSNHSSRESSRNRKSNQKWDSTNSSDDDEEDDVPLSKLHPDASIAQQEAALKRRKKREVAKLNQLKLVGRNPGAETGWNGEGGIPSKVLFSRLEKLSIDIERRSSMLETVQRNLSERVTSGREREQSVPSISSQQRSATLESQPLQSHSRSKTEPTRPNFAQRFHSQNSNPHRPANIVTSPETLSSPRIPSPVTSTKETLPRPSISSDGHSTSSTAPRLPPIPIDRPNLMRADTSASIVSTRSRSKSNATSPIVSTARHGLATDENMIRPALPSSSSSSQSKPMYVRGFIESIEGKKMTLELQPGLTTSRDILSSAMSMGELPRPAEGECWVIVELFAELGCERYIREYEVLSTVVKGWDGANKYNSLILKLSKNGMNTWLKAIPRTAPFLGSWVQWESKKGKWTKRWLETRGGQVFLSKNEKGKDELQINTTFFDVYQMTRAYPGPKPFVFLMKRVEPESVFLNPEEYTHTFSMDEGTGWKLMSAIYDAKSFALRPHVLARTNPAQSRPQPQRRPTQNQGPLLDISKQEEERTGFTGKGLLQTGRVTSKDSTTKNDKDNLLYMW